VKGTKKKRKPALKVGSTVRFRFGITDVTAKVVEDRGPLGRDGEHIYRVQFWFREPGGPSETEIEASRLRVVRAAA
jgi:hypothetical protein